MDSRVIPAACRAGEEVRVQLSRGWIIVIVIVAVIVVGWIGANFVGQTTGG